ncbi:MAG: hypothetical protein MR567_07685 [Oscillospiraceae bacterium]|nr:hypothetical protein [Oscillospiraceae bacterium]
MKKEIKIVAIVLAALIVFLGGFGLGATKGIEINVDVKGNGSAQSAAPVVADTTPATQPPATQPATEAPTAAPATEAPSAEAPAADAPAAPAGDASSAPAADAPAASTGVPATPAEVVAKYNEVINTAKKDLKYTGMHKVGTIDIQCTDCSVSFLQGTVDKLLQGFMKGTDKTFTVANGVATDQDGGQADMNAYIVPNGRDAALKEEYVASATATPAGDGYTLNITLKSEQSSYDGTTTVNPVGHESCLDPLNLATLELPAGAQITNASMTYPGATLTVDVNGAGQMTKLDVKLPLEGTGTGKLGAELTLGLKGEMHDTYDFTY